MIFFNNVSALQFLLEQGANPNILNSRGKSTLEQVLTNIWLRVVNHAAGLGPALSETDIIQSEKMADLLLCFGLDHHKVIWTNSFLTFIKNRKDELDPSKSAQLKYIKKFCVEGSSEFEKRDANIFMLKHSIKVDRAYRLCIHSTSNIVKSLELSSIPIQLEKKDILSVTAKNIGECINPALSLPFLFIILEYANTMLDISMQVAKTRIEEGSKANFWLKKSRNLFDYKLFRDIYSYAAMIKSILPVFKKTAFRPDTSSLNQLMEIIAEYTLDDTTHSAKRNTKNGLK
jgi:hypothetical protein